MIVVFVLSGSGARSRARGSKSRGRATGATDVQRWGQQRWWYQVMIHQTPAPAVATATS